MLPTFHLIYFRRTLLEKLNRLLSLEIMDLSAKTMVILKWERGKYLFGGCCEPGLTGPQEHRETQV